MFETSNIYATLVDLNGMGILLKGKSGSGKSDVALRLIENKKAKLVADDRVILSAENNELWGEAPQNLQGLLEVRGVGIVKQEFMAKSKIKLIVNLLDSADEVERLPYYGVEVVFGVEIPKIDLYANDISVADKIVVKLRNNLIDDCKYEDVK